ncbi:MAG: TetR/AcrR family transcriptional regulator [Herbinix sp.]|nr:TetR/AcrR family transcriptional regulator [Herbinix sp.]
MGKENISSRKLQANETRNKIYETAKKLFLEHGFENVSVDSIVEAAGVSKGSFYVHFKSKDVLPSIFINDYINNADLDYKIYLEDKDSKVPTSEVLILVTGRIAELMDGRIGCDIMKNIYKSHITKSIDTNYSMIYSRELYKVYVDILERGLRLGDVKSDIPVDTLAKHLILALRGITFEWCIQDSDFNLKEQYITHIELLMHGILIH